jgi:hypothetical protein
VEGASQPYQNIHVNLELTIEVSGASPKSGTPIDELLKSLGSSVNAYLLQTLTEGKTLSARNLGLLRDNLTSQARIIVESWLAEKHGPEIYKAEALVVSLYFTGPSIGRSPSR